MKISSKAKHFLFVCVGNSGRSQMAEAFALRLGQGVIEAHSAGTQPADALDPTVVEAMQEIGYNIHDQYPKPLPPDMEEWADRIITMGCGVTEGSTCPVFSAPVEDWGLEDPHFKSIKKVRQIRDTIKAKVEALIVELSKEE